MLNRFRLAQKRYPRQFWLLFWGSLVSSTGASMVWPFLTIYLRHRLNIPLTLVTSLLTLNSIMGILASFIAGSVADRFGRKSVMIASLIAGTTYYFLMSRAGTLGVFAALMGLWGAFNPLYAVGANAMIADLIPADGRMEAYALLRVVQNVGVATGPIIGGFLTTLSYSTAFTGAALAYACFGLLIIFSLPETLSRLPGAAMERNSRLDLSHVFHDPHFLFFVASFITTNMAASIMFTLLPVYAKENFGVPESQYSFIVTANALMVIFLQYSVTQITKRFPALPVLSVGAVFYAAGLGSISLGSSFWTFLPGMIIMSTGELIMSPTATTLTANLSPPDMRGRYMSLFGLSWPIGAGIGPVMAGFLSEKFAPVGIWYGGMVFGLISALGFLLMTLRWPGSTRPISQPPPERLGL